MGNRPQPSPSSPAHGALLPSSLRGLNLSAPDQDMVSSLDLGGPTSSQGSLTGMEGELGMKGKGHVKTEAETGRMLFEDGGRADKPRNTGGQEKRREQVWVTEAEIDAVDNTGFSALLVTALCYCTLGTVPLCQ